MFVCGVGGEGDDVLRFWHFGGGHGNIMKSIIRECYSIPLIVGTINGMVREWQGAIRAIRATKPFH